MSGASPKFYQPDNLAEALAFAADDADVPVAVARHLLATFFRQWTGPRGGTQRLTAIADQIEGAA